MFDLMAHLSTLIKIPERGAELVIRGEEIPADPAAAADFCAEQDEALHERGFMRTGAAAPLRTTTEVTPRAPGRPIPASCAGHGIHRLRAGRDLGARTRSGPQSRRQ